MNILNDNASDLLKHVDLYRVIIETMYDMITVWDMNLTLIYVSPSVDDLLGYNSEETREIISHWKESDLESLIAPGSVDTFSDTVRKWIKGYAKRDASERNSPMELELIRKDGSTIWTETKNRFLRNSDRERTGFFSITRDISERKHTQKMLLKSEERYRNILDSIEEGYFENDLAGNLTFFNNALYRAMGYSKEN